MSFAAAEMARRLDGMLSIGRVSEVDYAAARAKVKTGDLRTGWLPWLTSRAGGDRIWHAPEIGEQVIVAALSGDHETAVILSGAIFSDAHPAPADAGTVHRTLYADGAIVEYDRAAHRLRALLPAGGEVEITAPGGVTINGDLVVTGDIRAGGAGGVSVLHHIHGGVTTGGATTDEPEK